MLGSKKSKSTWFEQNIFDGIGIWVYEEIWLLANSQVQEEKTAPKTLRKILKFLQSLSKITELEVYKFVASVIL